MNSTEDLARRAAHLVGLAGDFIDWAQLSDLEFRRLIELVDVSQPEMSDELFEALSLLLQGESVVPSLDYDPLLSGNADLTSNVNEQPPELEPGHASPFRVIRGGKR